MALFASNPPSLIPAKQQSGGSVNQTAARLSAGSRAVKDAAAQAMFQSTGGALSSLQDQIDNILRVMRAPIPQPSSYSVTDPNGNLIAWLGYSVVNNVPYQGGWFSNLYVGGTAADNAPLFSNGSQVVIGKNGQVFIQDLSGNTVGWFGVENETAQVITVATNASPSVITIAAHGYVNGDTIGVAGALGNTAINGYRIVQNVTLNTFTMTDLSGAAINGNGAYTGSGTATRYYAGVLTQTIAIGESFSNYKLRAFADGSLKIQGATISLSGTGGTIVLDPTSGAITVTNAGGGNQVIIQSGTITYQVVDVNGAVILDDSSGSIAPGLWQSFNSGLTSLSLSRVVDIYGYTGATAFGPLLSLSQFRGTPTAATATHLGDTIGGMIGWGYDGAGESQYPVGIRMLASELHSITAHGTKILFEATNAGTTALTPYMTLDPSNASALLTVDGVAAADTGTGGYARMVPGGSGQTGYFDWYNKNRVRIAYCGFTDGDLVMNLVSVNMQILGGRLGIKKSAGYDVDALGDVNADGVFRKGGTAGVTSSITPLTSATLNTTTIQYKDWAGINQSIGVVTSITLGTNTYSFSGGIRTT